MSKLFLVLVIAAYVLCINADTDEGENARAENADPRFPLPMFQNGFPGMPPMGQFPAMGQFPPMGEFPSMGQFPTIKPLTPDDIAKMSPSDGNSVVKGSFVSTSSTMETVNGVPVVNEKKARVVENDNGNVTDTSYSN